MKEMFHKKRQICFTDVSFIMYVHDGTQAATVYMVIFAWSYFCEFRESDLAIISTSIYVYRYIVMKTSEYREIKPSRICAPSPKPRKYLYAKIMLYTVYQSTQLKGCRIVLLVAYFTTKVLQVYQNSTCTYRVMKIDFTPNTEKISTTI